MHRLRGWIIVVHRYLGIALCLIFVMWFMSGIAMIYARDMPRLTPAVRQDRLVPLDLSRVQLTAAEAADKAGLLQSPGALTLLTVINRPAYRFTTRGTTIFADTGERFEGIGEAGSLAAAARFVNVQLSSVHYAGRLDEADQWTISQRRQLPLHKIVVDDGDRTGIYVADRLGEVVLMTTRGSRALAWVAAIPHWLYFAPLRLNDSLWRQVILWTSGLGMVSALAGLILAVMQFGVRYPGLFWWHYICGAIVGVFALTWVSSGLLSMEPWDWAGGERAGENVPRALSGGTVDLTAFPPIDASRWSGSGALKEIEFHRIQDAPYLVTRAADRRATVILPASFQTKAEDFSIESIEKRVREAEPAARISESTLLLGYDAYYYDRDRDAPLPILRIKFDDPHRTWLYVDPRLSQVVASFTRKERVQRWLYHGLHSLDFPFWYDKRPLWDIVVIVLCTGGAILSGLGAILGFRRIRRAMP